MKKITFLAPFGATFSHEAYSILSRLHQLPEATIENFVPATVNGHVLSLIEEHGGYGTVAMETRSEGRISEALESFMGLLGKYQSAGECPFGIIGALKLRLNFCLMRRQEASGKPREILGHAKALGACRRNIEILGASAQCAPSNGEAARLIAEEGRYAAAAALGPRSAASRYGLEVIDATFEDAPSVTTFFLIAPNYHRIVPGKVNRVLLIFRLADRPGALADALMPFHPNRFNLNMTQIHSAHVENQSYDFALEIELNAEELDTWPKALELFAGQVERHLAFGPFEVMSHTGTGI